MYLNLHGLICLITYDGVNLEMKPPPPPQKKTKKKKKKKKKTYAQKYSLIYLAIRDH